MIAAKMMDQVLGVDIHIIQPPGPVPPLPIPHPFIGFVIDPMDLAPIIGATVMVNGMPRATAGTGCKNIPPHIPIGGTFIKPPGNEGEIFMGSSTVLADGCPLSFLAMPVLSCSDIGMPPPPRAKKKGGAKTLLLPTSVLIAVPAGMPVLVGGPPTIDMMAMAMKAGLSALGKGMKKLRKLQKGSKRMARLSQKMKNAAKKAMDKLGVPPSIQNKVNKAICSVTGHPVDIASGKVFTDHIDFELPGPIPLIWERTWYSTSVYNGPLGHGWHHSYDMALNIDETNEVVVLRMQDGRSVAFPTLEVGEETYDRQDRLSLHRDENGYYIKDVDQLSYRFHKFPQQEIQPLASITNGAGFSIEFSYTQLGHLRQIKDSANRILLVSSDSYGCITKIEAPHPEREGEYFPIIRYSYDQYSNMARTQDAHNQSFHYEYENYLLVKETNRNGLSFYFEYDGKDHHARCLHTWGDGGIYDHKLTYAGGLTIVENSLGQRSKHYHNGAVVFREVDPLGNETIYEYNQYFEKIAQTDPLGRVTQYAYDERGNQTLVQRPDETSLQFQYENDLLVSATDAIGGSWTWDYDEQGKLISRKNPLGHEHTYKYENGLVKEITDPQEGKTVLTYDSAYNLTHFTTPEGARSRWKYDHLGNCRISIDPRGNVQRRIFDLMQQVIRIDEPDMNRRHLEYDPEGNVVRARDKQRDVSFEYQGMGRMKARKEAGTRIIFEYNTEEDLIAIKNEHNTIYTFELNANREIEIESGFDGIRRHYRRDAAGQVKSVLRASGIETKYAYDALGRVINIKHSTGEEQHYTYRSDGELMEASNNELSVFFERDELGRVIKEKQGEHELSYTYNLLGFRAEVQSSLGAHLTYTRNLMGDVEQLSFHSPSKSWDTYFKRDLQGLELSRSFSSGLRSRWKRDQLGRPLEQQITGGGGKQLRRRSYAWEVNDRLKQLIDAQFGTTQFIHDTFGNLASAHYGDGTTENRLPDEVGNLFRKADRKDRKYGPAGQLLEAEGARYRYDEEGNLSEKIETDGQRWRYEWNATGMLKQVIRPDGKEVSFTYDALGRRISKSFDQRKTRWVWDGNNPLHEWQEVANFPSPVQVRSAIRIASKGKIKIKPRGQNVSIATATTAISQRETVSTAAWNLPNANFTTWIFEAESFAPLAKIQDGQQYAICTDHLGTPVGMYDEDGETIWSADMSIYGDLRNLKGDREACPFRFPGQYEDVETGLYYNRFRYYSPEMGGYVSQDPIGLAGNNPNIYAYTYDSNSEIDPFGLDCNKAKWGKNDYAKGGEMPAIDHIWKEHSFHKAPQGKSKFRQNINTKNKVKSMVNETVAPENLVSTSKDGTKNFVKTFDHSIGTDINGKSTKKMIVHTDSNGWVKSAYPL